jgi:hypothetical protein
MTEIRIPKNITPNKLNKLFDDSLIRKDLSNITLSIPNSINKYTFGLLANLLKLVITLNKKSSIKTLKIDIDHENLENFYDQEYAYPIVSLLWNTSNFIDKNLNEIKPKLRELQNKYFIKMNGLSRFKGNKYILTNTDHLSRNSGLIKLFENSNGFNDNEEQITKSVKKILNNYVLTFNKNNLTEIDNIIDDIGAIIYELAKNTYEWGKTDSQNIDLPSSIRGIYFRFHKNNKEKISQEFKDTPLETYFKQNYILNECTNGLNQVYFLEILVFDSGVGFIEKFNKKDSLTDLEIIKKCLIKNQTSSITNLKSKKGLGLDRILNILNKKGFVKITTNKYSVYRNLIKDNHKPTNIDDLDSLILEDWNKNDFKTKNMINATGSHISILYPFKSIS